MSIQNFVKALLPRMRKTDILEDVRLTKRELETIVIPSYKDGVEYFKLNKFQSPETKDLATIYFRNLQSGTLGSSKQLNYIADVHSRIPNLLFNLVTVEESLEKLLESDILRDGMMSKKAVLVRFAEQSSFVSRYAIDLLDFTYVKETEFKVGQSDFPIPPGKKIKITSNIIRFSRILSTFSLKPADFKNKLEANIDLNLFLTDMNVLTAYDEDKVNPFDANLGDGFTANPIYHIRLQIAEWQADRYKSYRDKKRLLELRLLNLKAYNSSKQDPNIEKEINYIQSRVDSIDYSMAQMES